MDWNIIMRVILIAVVTLYILWEIEKKGLEQTVIHLIAMAECMYKKGENTEKFNYVFDRIYKLLPDGLKIYVSKDAVKTFIQNIFNKIKVTLDAKAPE